jgi:hypothetical protein
MVDKTGLQIIGWIFGGTTLAVALIATLLVGHAIASGNTEADDVTASIGRLDTGH